MPFKTIRGLRVHAYDSFARHVNVTNASTTRHGGVSPAPYDSLNLGGSTEDAPENVDANRAKLSLLTSHDLESVAWAGQVHGNTVAIVDAGDAGRRFESTDALVTNAVEVSIVILTADCAAVSLYDPIKRAIGLVHAGWRGTVAGVASHAIERMMNTFGTDPTDLIAGIGPSIGPCCYEVGSDVVDSLRAEQPLVADHVLTAGDGAGKQNLNLWRANTLQLVTAGVFEANIEVAGICTVCNTQDFYSHRATGGRTGRFAGVMMLHERTKRSY
jgi:YfiH family protein